MTSLCLDVLICRMGMILIDPASEETSEKLEEGADKGKSLQKEHGLF